VQLHINIDHVATLRQARGTSYPDPVWAAAACELAGADGITIHLREDRRHIQDRDVHLLRQTVRSVLNLEMAATDEMVGIAKEIKPDIVTLVPEKRQERTTEGGLNLSAGKKAIVKAHKALKSAGIEVSLFIDPTREAVRASAELGVSRIELHTGDYCNQTALAKRRMELERIAESAEEGTALGLHVAAGHGLDYPNVGPVAAAPGIVELNIGHAVIARAVLVGLERAVREMIAAVREARPL
jgi:pyridoxine 5-phosphate synthase